MKRNDKPIEEITGLSLQTYWRLKQNNINYASQIFGMSRNDIMNLRHMSLRDVDHLEELLGIHFED